MQRSHKPEQAPVRAVPEPVAANPDEVAGQDVVALDAVPAKRPGGGGLHGPQDGLAAVPLAGNLKEDPGVRVEQVHFLDRPLEMGKVGEFVVAVGMMRPTGEGEDDQAEEQGGAGRDSGHRRTHPSLRAVPVRNVGGWRDI